MLEIQNFQEDIAGSYCCLVSNPSSAVLSRPVVVGVQPVPVVSVSSGGGGGGGGAAATSAPITMTAAGAPAASPAGLPYQPVSIVRRSGDCAVAVGDTLRLEVLATGHPSPTYQVGAWLLRVFRMCMPAILLLLLHCVFRCAVSVCLGVVMAQS